ncbi:purine-cytosine permease family protein [Kitasatospora indigofera]|uniref:purine-cytosine permease family protein n=1 Tax=Kitasatospora indigofera TaxID=67307 RepID=UPI00367E9943
MDSRHSPPPGPAPLLAPNAAIEDAEIETTEAEDADLEPARGGNSGGNRAGRIEVRGIDRVPDAERHGRPRDLFWVWFAANITYLYFLLGGFVLLTGLNLWQSIAVVVAGNLYWVGVGTLAVSGPASGTPGVVVTRAMFGIRGNRPLSAGIGWLIAVAYEAVNLALGALAGFALAAHLGLSVSTPVKVAILVVIAAATFAISVYGHATIVRVSPWFTALLAAAMVLLTVFVLGHTRADYAPPHPLHGAPLLTALCLGVALIAAVPLSWANGADYARYLPATTSKRDVLLSTALGAFVPAVLLGVLGVLAGTSIDMGDPQTNLAAIVPGWFYPVFLFVVVFSSLTNNVLTAYSSGLCLQSVGLRASRSRTVLIDAALSVGIAGYALFVNDFIDSLNNILAVTVVILAPSMALYVCDIVLRRNRYDGVALHDETPAGRYWYHAGFNVAGTLAFALGALASLLCVNTTVYQGPLSLAMGGADLSFLSGPLVTAAVYAVLWRRSERGAGRG